MSIVNKPIFLEPIFKSYIWGGTKLKEKLNKKSEEEKIAESWEISTNKNGKSKIKNGEYLGKTLEELYNNVELKEKIFGTKLSEIKEFPLLIKYIDASESLSVQVHPDDEFARKNENSLGKTELWYIMDCKENAKIVCGLKDISEEKLSNLGGKDIKKHLKYVDVKKGDYVYIEAGTVHAILDGIMICEIQQNSDITYRLYDWDRVDKDGKGRELHLEKAREVIDISDRCKVEHSKNIPIQNIADNKYFKIDIVNVDGEYIDKTDVTTFYAYNVVEGSGVLKVENIEYKLEIGDSYILPASLGEYKIKGNIKLLKSYL